MASFIWFSCILALVQVDLVCMNKTIYIGGFFAMTGKIWRGGISTLPPIKLALDYVNNNSEILPDYHIKLLWNDTAVSHCSLVFIKYLKIYII